MEPQHDTATPARERRPSRHPRRGRIAWGTALATALTLALGGGGLLAPPTAWAQVAAPHQPAPVAPLNTYQRGPDPTESSIEAARGPYAISTEQVSRLGQEFGGGTIHYPETTSEGTFGAVAVVPGYTGTESSISWLGPRIASHGFVVITMDTKTLYDQPASRGDQLLAALDYVVTKSGVRDRVDGGRLATMGHSMGGGGVLEASKDRPSLRAGIPMTPWNTDKTWGEITTPMFVIGAENDTVAPVSTHAIPFYESLPSTTDRAYLELGGASHFAPNSPHTTLAKYSVSWLKRFVDEDTRYEQFLCPLPDDPEISDMRGNCPH